ncbi:hypothetical protein ACFWA9_38260 [Kitasatospora sp. NPDC059973]|uniref:hypothetical protein n=1 Tax=Kitasatospora sp. NPDC059973 TaxID=3347020 RepID=UPI0036CB82ED
MHPTLDDGRRAFLNQILANGESATWRPLDPYEIELFSMLTDFFTRTVVLPGQIPPDDYELHTSDPSRALAWLFLNRLEREDLHLGGGVPRYAVGGWKSPSRPEPGGPVVRSYRITARRIEGAEAQEATITTSVMAASVEEAVQKTKEKHERERGLYGIGVYRIVRVEEEHLELD